jgi:sec-independent protein translocase protein TatA
LVCIINDAFISRSQMLQSVGLTEVLIVVGLLILLFGAKRLPIFAKGLGQSTSEFKKAFKDDEPKKKPAEKKN